jgi:hypothetical protein
MWPLGLATHDRQHLLNQRHRTEEVRLEVCSRAIDLDLL